MLYFKLIASLITEKAELNSESLNTNLLLLIAPQKSLLSTQTFKYL